jgi:hypothetical protein
LPITLWLLAVVVVVMEVVALAVLELEQLIYCLIHLP